MEQAALHTSPAVAPFWFGSPSRVRQAAADGPSEAPRQTARELAQLTRRAGAVPQTRPDAVARARRELRRGHIDSHSAIAAAVRAMRVGG